MDKENLKTFKRRQEGMIL